MGALLSSSDPQISKAVNQVSQKAVFSQQLSNSSAHVARLTVAEAGQGSATLAIEQMIEKYFAGLPITNTLTDKDRQANAFFDKGFDLHFLESEKLAYLGGDSDVLRLSDEVYEQLRSSLLPSLITPGDWTSISFGLFEPNIWGSCNLIYLSSHSNHASTVRFLFTPIIASSPIVGRKQERKSTIMHQRQLEEAMVKRNMCVNDFLLRAV